MKKLLLSTALLALTLFASPGWTQETFPRNDVADERMGMYALTNAHIVVSSSRSIENATLLIKEGKIVSAGAAIPIPAGYVKIDLSGKHVYPSFIDLDTHYGLPEPEKRTGGRGRGGAEQIPPNTRGAYSSNDAIKAHFHAGNVFEIDEKGAKKLRESGFGTALSYRDDGIARGTSALVTLGGTNANKVTLNPKAAAHYSLNKGSSNQNYPRSMMGYISLLRQTFLDAEWFENLSEKPFTDQSLEAWIANQSLPQIFAAGNWMNVLRADKVGDEFGVQYIIAGGTDMYQRIAEVKKTNASLIIPMNFPEAFDVEDPLDAEKVTLKDMLHWELAPTNAAVLESNGITFAVTMHGLKSGKELFANLRSSIKHGLSKAGALDALTIVPARLLNAEKHLGTLEAGKIANFLVTDGKLFDEKTVIYENWIQGERFHFKDLETNDFSGKYTLQIGSNTYEVEVTGKPGSHKTKLIVDDSTTLDIKSDFSDDLLTLNFKPEKSATENIRLSGWVEGDRWVGRGQLGDGSWTDWSASPVEGEDEEKEEKEKSEEKEEDLVLGQVLFPFTAYGTTSLPTADDLLIANATVWTNEAEGILEDTDVLLKNGKISAVGEDLSAGNAKVIDGEGMHLTAGIIDEHTHIGGGGNDVATNSGMVRIGDQLNSEQINLYRALAGGVTAAQVLHGSANPIGGQSALIKLRWGSAPDELKIEGADEFIKFALGENVKRSRSSNSIRYPQTRMGVEQVYVDAFSQAKDYEKKWAQFNAGGGEAPRRDLAHEAMLEIVNKERFITCHSYVQSEINMLMHVADQFGFNINTFTHILEGYKVADKMAAHGVGGSSFSDWWNYKWEVRYAIPYNPVLMHNAGVLTAINSDDANMGRRLNQEAAKSIKYGGMSEEEAWKMVTLNPAKLLHLDDQMGSIKVGKDADVVLWTDHPLSMYARADKTIVDGKIYFDLAEDISRREMVSAERNRLIQKMVGAKKAGKPTSKRSSRLDMEIHCESVLGIESHGHH